MNLDHIKHLLTKEYGGLPVWAWGLIGIGGLALGWYLVKGFSNVSSGSGDTGTPVVPTVPSPTPSPIQGAPVAPTPNPPTTQPPTDGGGTTVYYGPTNGGGGPIVAPTNPIPISHPILGVKQPPKLGTEPVKAPRNTQVESKATDHAKTPVASEAMNNAARVLTNISGIATFKATSQPIRTPAGRGPGNVAS